MAAELIDGTMLMRNTVQAGELQDYDLGESETRRPRLAIR